MFLAYHEITTGRADYAYEVTAERLAQHLELLSARRADPAWPEVGVTFDDGYRSQHELALGHLEQAGVRALFFVTAGFVETSPESITWAQLRELADRGHEVQAHGYRHRWLTTCDRAALAEELRGARETIEDRLGRPVDALSAPHGRWNRRVLREAGRGGYRRVFTSDDWLAPAERDGVFVAGRLMVRNRHTREDVERMVGLSGLPLLARGARGRLKLAARGLLGERLYHALWLRLARSRPTSAQGAPHAP